MRIAVQRPRTLRLSSTLGYNISMRRKKVYRFTGYRLSGCLFAFVLSLAQVYPAFAACICLPEAEPTFEVAVPADDLPACHTDPGEANPQESAEEMDPESCTTVTHQVAGFSSETCCFSLAIYASEIRASIRYVETRSSLDAAPVVSVEDRGQRVTRSAGYLRPPEVGEFNRERPPLYLSNASLLI